MCGRQGGINTKGCLMSKLRGCSVILRATVDFDTGGCGRTLSGESVVMRKERARLRALGMTLSKEATVRPH